MITLSTLSDPVTIVTLPPYLIWEDELTWSPVEQHLDYTAAGSLEIQESVKLAGRPITLAGTANRGWIPRSALLDLYALTAVPQDLTLSYHSRDFSVRFSRLGGKPVSAEPVIVRIPPKATDLYHSLRIRLLEV